MTMQRLILAITTMIICINAYLHLNAMVGCLDNSWHLKKFPDYKEYHMTDCNCPCWKYKTREDRNQCTRCLHYHTFEPVNPKIEKAFHGTRNASNIATKKIIINKQNNKKSLIKKLACAKQ